VISAWGANTFPMCKQLSNPYFQNLQTSFRFFLMFSLNKRWWRLPCVFLFGRHTIYLASSSRRMVGCDNMVVLTSVLLQRRRCWGCLRKEVSLMFFYIAKLFSFIANLLKETLTSLHSFLTIKGCSSFLFLFFSSSHLSFIVLDPQQLVKVSREQVWTFFFHWWGLFHWWDHCGFLSCQISMVYPTKCALLP